MYQVLYSKNILTKYLALSFLKFLKPLALPATSYFLSSLPWSPAEDHILWLQSPSLPPLIFFPLIAAANPVIPITDFLTCVTQH